VPRLKCTFLDFIAILEQHQFKCVRQEGSHRQYRDPYGNLVTVAYHNINVEISPKTLESMIRQSGLSKKLFRK